MCNHEDPPKNIPTQICKNVIEITIFSLIGKIFFARTILLFLQPKLEKYFELA